MSEQLKKKSARGAASRHKNQLRFLRETARRRAGMVVTGLSDPKEAAAVGNNFQSEKAYFVPRRSHTARPANDPRPVTPADFELERKRAAVAGLDRRIAQTKAALRTEGRGRNIAAIWLPRQPKWLRLMRQAQTMALFQEMRELQRRRYRTFLDYRAARRRLIAGPGATRTVGKRGLKLGPSLARTRPLAPKPTITRPAPKPKRGFGL